MGALWLCIHGPASQLVSGLTIVSAAGQANAFVATKHLCSHARTLEEVVLAEPGVWGAAAAAGLKVKALCTLNL